MSLDDMLNYGHLIPDDIEDVREFTNALYRTVHPDRVDELTVEFIMFIEKMDAFLVQLDKTRFTFPAEAIKLTLILNLFKFLKRNEPQIRALISVVKEGCPHIG